MAFRDSIMLPIVFKEQLDKTPNAPIPEPKISLRDYKINYNDFLGQGYFGKVYGLSKRPDDERTFFSDNFPYLHDALFITDTLNEEEPEWCIKISRSIFGVFFRALDNGLYFGCARLLEALIEKHTQQASHNLLKKYHMTNMIFSETPRIFAQIKTRVRGKSLGYHINQYHFLLSDQYALRKAYLDFIWKINNVALEFDDLHFGNVMFDEESGQMEIIDGSAREVRFREKVSYTSLPSNYCKLPYFFPVTHQEQTQERVLRALQKIAANLTPFTEELDRELLEKANKPMPHEFYSTNSLHFFKKPLHEQFVTPEERAENVICKRVTY